MDSFGTFQEEKTILLKPDFYRDGDKVFVQDASSLVKYRIQESRNLQNKEIDHEFSAFIGFFKTYPIVSISNFASAEKLFRKIFDSKKNLNHVLYKLKEKCEENFYETDRFGNLVLDSLIKSPYLKLALDRTKLKDVKQFLSLDLDSTNPHAFIAYTKWDWKNPKYEIIRSFSPNIPYPKPDAKSIAFDAKIWQSFNSNGIHRKNLLKSLDCLERNRHTLPDFIREINRKSISNIFTEDLINGVSIKTDNQDTVFLSFKTSSGQKIAAKLTGFASSIGLAS